MSLAIRYANIFTEGDFFGEFSLFDTDDICDYPVRVITDDAKLIVIKKDKKFVNAMSPDMQEHIEHMADSFKSVLINALHKFESHENEFHCSPLYNFEHECVLAVDIMLGFFAFANAGVPVTGIGAMTCAAFPTCLALSNARILWQLVAACSCFKTQFLARTADLSWGARCSWARRSAFSWRVALRTSFSTAGRRCHKA